MTTKPLKRVYADFNNCDGEGRVRLNVMGSRRDLERLAPLEDGDLLDLYDDELSVSGIAEYSEAEKMWTGRFDWKDLASTERQVDSISTRDDELTEADIEL